MRASNWNEGALRRRGGASVAATAQEVLDQPLQVAPQDRMPPAPRLVVEAPSIPLN